MDPEPIIVPGKASMDQADIDRLVDARIKQYFFNLKFLGAGGAILLLALTYFHKDIIGGLVNYGGTHLRQTIENNNNQYLERYKADYQTHLNTIRATERSLETAQNKVMTTNAFLERQQELLLNKISEFRTEYFALTKQAESFRNDSDEAQKKINNLIKILEETSEVTRTRIAAAQQSAVQEMEKRVAELEKRINAVQTTVTADLKDRGVAKSISTITPVSARVERPTVYFQFAGFSREEAQSISRAIRDRGRWDIPGEERTVKAANTNEIRYNPADRAAALSLVTDAQAALQALGMTLPLTPKESRSVRAGFIEIWISKD